MNITNTTGLSNALPHHQTPTHSTSTMGHRFESNQVNNLGKGLGSLVRMAFTQVVDSWQTLWKKEPSAEEIAFHKQGIIYREGLKRFIERLDIACENIRKNPNDPHALKKIQLLVSQNPNFVKQQERADLRDYQNELFKPLEKRISKWKPALQAKLTPLLSMVFHNLKSSKKVEEKEKQSLSNDQKLRTKKDSQKEEAQKRDRRQTNPCLDSLLSFDLNNLGAKGLIINIPNSLSDMGPVISPIGDVNGDQVGDIALGIPYASPGGLQYAGQVAIILGGQNVTIDLSNPGPNVIIINGEVAKGLLGSSITALNDINQDGHDDFAMGAPALNTGNIPEALYVVLGPVTGPIDLANLNGTNGFKVVGTPLSFNFATSINGGEDINGDGSTDMLIGAPFGSSNGTSATGQFFGVFGHPNPWPALVNLTNLINGVDAFVGNGFVNGDQLGTAMSMGNLNGVGPADFVVTAIDASPPGMSGADTGMFYAVYGHNGTWPAVIDLNLNGTDGFAGYGLPGEFIGGSIAIGGDLNKDGKSDIVVGAESSSPSGKFYVFYNRPNPSDALVNLPALNSTYAIDLTGIAQHDLLGGSVTVIDINNDGNSDLVAGMPGANPASLSNAGEVVGVLGQAKGLAPGTNIPTLNVTTGFTVDGPLQNSQLGLMVNNIGDFNGDGIEDLGISANATAYILWGQNSFACPPPSTPTPPSTSTTSSASTSTSSPAPSSHSSGNAKVLGIALGVSAGALLAGVVAAVLLLKYKKKGCFAEKSTSMSKNRTDGVLDINL